MTTIPDLSNIIPLKNNLLADQKYADAVALIVNRIRALPNFMKYRGDAEVLLLICNLIEHITKDDIKIDKEGMAIDALTQIFTLNPTEIDVAKATIKFLDNHNRIKQLNMVYVAGKGCMAYLKKKLA